MFKNGETVICVSKNFRKESFLSYKRKSRRTRRLKQKANNITIGKKYKVLDDLGNNITVVNDEGNPRLYRTYLFKSLQDIKLNKIKNICSRLGI